jgi:hypothetical protein
MTRHLMRHAPNRTRHSVCSTCGGTAWHSTSEAATGFLSICGLRWRCFSRSRITGYYGSMHR